MMISLAAKMKDDEKPGKLKYPLIDTSFLVYETPDDTQIYRTGAGSQRH